MRRALRVFSAAILLLIFGCGEQSPKNYYEHKSGLSFLFPDGWSTLSKQEWKDMQLGDDNTVVTIMDESRVAGFSLIVAGLDFDDQLVIEMLGDEPAARTVMSLESIHAAGPGRYQEYKLFEKTATLFAGAPLGEMTYQGRNPGKALKWYRLLVLAVPNTREALLMMVFTAPMGQQDEYKEDFAFIENTWKWGN